MLQHSVVPHPQFPTAPKAKTSNSPRVELKVKTEKLKIISEIWKKRKKNNTHTHNKQASPASVPEQQGNKRIISHQSRVDSCICSRSGGCGCGRVGRAPDSLGQGRNTGGRAGRMPWLPLYSTARTSGTRGRKTAHRHWNPRRRWNSGRGALWGSTHTWYTPPAPRPSTSSDAHTASRPEGAWRRHNPCTCSGYSARMGLGASCCVASPFPVLLPISNACDRWKHFPADSCLPVSSRSSSVAPAPRHRAGLHPPDFSARRWSLHPAPIFLVPIQSSLVAPLLLPPFCPRFQPGSAPGRISHRVPSAIPVRISPAAPSLRSRRCLPQSLGLRMVRCQWTPGHLEVNVENPEYGPLDPAQPLHRDSSQTSEGGARS